MGIQTNAPQIGDTIQRKADALAGAVSSGMRSALLATEAAAVKLLSGSNGAAPWSYPVPARTGNLKNARLVSQPSPGVGVIAFFADYAWAIHSGVVNQWAGRGKTRQAQRTPRPFADDAVRQANPASYLFSAVGRVLVQ